VLLGVFNSGSRYVVLTVLLFKFTGIYISQIRAELCKSSGIYMSCGIRQKVELGSALRCQSFPLAPTYSGLL
jgi:hypothetical protein